MTSIITGVVIASRDHKETDRFYTVYSKERGKIRILAKGTRKFKSKLAAHMTPFTELQIMIAHGKIWPKLASVERQVDFRCIREDLTLYGLGLGLNELLYRAIGDQEPDDKLYDFLIDAYSWIQTLPELESQRLQFVHSALTLKWLVMIGFGPHCDACVSCHKAHTEVDDPHVTVSHGGLVCHVCVVERRLQFADARRISTETLAALRFLATAPFESLLTEELDPILELLIDIQDEFIHYHLERDLRVPVFLEQIVSSK
ncbi:MAG TPA: DNA repair protein RecO [Patescibacteria group bacterium]|nr:DNA repair protein RecO [Patescibacteria group bacterium]